MHFSNNLQVITIMFYTLLGVAVIIFVLQIFFIRKYHKLIKDLASAYKIDKRRSLTSIVERIIRFREVYQSGFLSEEVELISNYISGFHTKYRIYIHVTKEQNAAESILKEGLKYSDDFFKSASEITTSAVDLPYKLQLYKYFGKNVVIICLPLDIEKRSNKHGVKGETDYLTDKGICTYNPDMEMPFLLPANYIKAYINIDSKSIVENPLFISGN